jgi:uncharacterized protein (TIGR02996 family)
MRAGMITTRTALYQAICAQPDEDLPRLAFADLIEDEGDDLWAAFIRSQIALARVPDYDPLAIATRQREPDVLTGWCMAHTLPPLPPCCSWQVFEFRRGFPWKLAVRSPVGLLSATDAVFQAAPIQALSFDPRTRAELEALPRWRGLARIRRLEFAQTRLSRQLLLTLGHSPLTAGVTELACECDSITAEGLHALVESEWFPRLRVLELRSNIIPPSSLVDALTAVPHEGQLVQLSLTTNRLAPPDIARLLAAPALRTLQTLDLSYNPLGPAGLEALAGSGLLRQLTTLHLQRTEPGAAGLRLLTESSGLANVRVLDLTSNRLGPGAIRGLVYSPHVRGLRVLKVSNNPLGEAGIRALAQSPQLAGLLELDIADTGLTEAGALALADSPYLGHLLRLNVASRDLGRPLTDHAQGALRERFGNRLCL